MAQDNTQQPNSQPAQPQAVNPAPQTVAQPQPVQPTPAQPQPQAPVAQAPAPVAQPQEPAPQASAQPQASAPAAQAPESAAQPVGPAATSGCKCPEIKEEDWDKKNTVINKTFYKTWSPRLFYYPFSFAIDIDRAMTAASKANCKIPKNGMILDTGGMFWSSVMIEVEGADPNDKNVVTLTGKNIYTKVSKRPWMEIKTDIEELKKEIAKEPLELYLWYTACPKCMDKKEIKTVLIAVI